VRSPNRIANLLRGLLSGGCLLAATSMSGGCLAIQSSGGVARFERCQTNTNGQERSNCYDEADSRTSVGRLPSDPSGWRLVRTPNPAGGRDAIWITHTADVSDSDLDFAGLMFRCQDDTIQMAIILTRPLPPGTNPQVTITVGATTAKFAASVAPPGVVVLLPAAATSSADDYERAAPDLVISLAQGQGAIRGVVPLAGLTAALQTLRSSCLER
jgi:hypothetical protein